jgi:hypothetical protein
MIGYGLSGDVIFTIKDKVSVEYSKPETSGRGGISVVEYSIKISLFLYPLQKFFVIIQKTFAA